MVTGPVPIGYVRSSYTDVDRLPPQSLDNIDATGEVIVRDDLVGALLGLDRYEHLWLLTWLGDEPIATQHPPLQLVPRATEASGEVQGVFASRAPRRRTRSGSVSCATSASPATSWSSPASTSSTAHLCSTS